MKSRIGILLVTFLSAVAGANTSAAAAGTNVPLAAQADAVFADYAGHDNPGCALGVFQGGRVVYENGYGLASLEHGVAIDPRQIVFDVASVSKQFTAASVLLLVQDGKLALSDDIRKYLPEMPDYGKTITIAHLLHHTSGLRDYVGLLMLAGWDAADYTDDRDALALITHQKALNFAPGSRFSYSNTGYFLLSQIVERVSGKRLGRFAHERIFAPLGMEDTLYRDDHQRVIPHRATGYEANADGFAVHMSDGEQTGDGGIQTTLADLAKWQRNFDKPNVGGRRLIEQMEMRGALDDGSALGYASGLFVDEYRGLPTLGHSGVSAGYTSMLLRFPGEQLSIAVLCNVGNAQAVSLARKVADVYLEQKFPKATKVPVDEQRSPVASHAKLPDAVGAYWSSDDAMVRRLEESDGKLWYVMGPKLRRELVPMGNGRFNMLNAPAQTEIQLQPSTGVVQKFKLTSSTGNLAFERVQELVPDANGVKEFAGVYSSTEINGVRWAVSVDGDHLTVQAPREEPVPLVPMFKDAFRVGPYLLRFQRDRSGRVASLLVDHARVRNLIFERSRD